MDADFFTFENLVNHVHGAITHFPIALLFVSVALDLVAIVKKPNLHWSAWLLLVLGTIGAVVATITGLISHFPYEEDPVLLAAIEPHQYTAFAATAVFGALTVWRWRFVAQRGTEPDPGTPYVRRARAPGADCPEEVFSETHIREPEHTREATLTPSEGVEE